MCHEYVHDGRLLHLLEKGQITRSHYTSVIQHGDQLLAEVGLKKLTHAERDAEIVAAIIQGKIARWEDWRLVIDLSPYRTRVLNKYKDKVLAKTSTYVGRGSLYGNPFVVGVDGDRNKVCDRYEKEILPKLNLMPLFGKDVVCFCSPARCHGDSILNALYRIAKFRPKFKNHEEWLIAHQ